MSNFGYSLLHFQPRALWRNRGGHSPCSLHLGERRPSHLCLNPGAAIRVTARSSEPERRGTGGFNWVSRAVMSTLYISSTTLSLGMMSSSPPWMTGIKMERLHGKPGPELGSTQHSPSHLPRSGLLEAARGWGVWSCPLRQLSHLCSDTSLRLSQGNI